MRIILRQDVSHVGRKDDIKEVANGYARNFLLPRNLAIPATEAALKAAGAQKAREEREHSQEYQKYQTAVEKLKTIVLHFKVKVGEKGKAFGSITAVKIRDALKKDGIAVEKDSILFEDPIKTTGEQTVGIKFPQDLHGEVKIIVEAE